MEITKKMLEAATQAANHQQLRVMYGAMKAERDAYLSELQKANAVIIDLQRNPPKLLEIHLQQVHAAAGRAGFVAGVKKARKMYGCELGYCKTEVDEAADQYADSILAGKE